MEKGTDFGLGMWASHVKEDYLGGGGIRGGEVPLFQSLTLRLVNEILLLHDLIHSHTYAKSSFVRNRQASK